MTGQCRTLWCGMKTSTGWKSRHSWGIYIGGEHSMKTLTLKDNFGGGVHPHQELCPGHEYKSGLWPWASPKLCTPVIHWQPTPTPIDNPRNATGSNMSLDIFYQVVHLHVWGRCAILDAGPDNPRYATGPSIPLNIFHQLVHANVWRRYDKLDLFCLRLPAMLCWLHQLLKAITSTHNYRIVAASVSAVSRFNHLSCCKESPTSAVICATSGPLEPALEWTSVIVVSGWQKNNTVWTRVGFLLTGSTVLGVHW